MEITHDIICQVYAGNKKKETIDSVLDKFIPEYEKLNLDYVGRPDDDKYVFVSEEEMINYYIDNNGLQQTFYWNKYHDNPDKIMVGANITEDDKLIISLTIDGNEETEKYYFTKLKEILKSNVGIVSYINPVEYENGQDFISRYKQNSSIYPLAGADFQASTDY